ncbi:hypothetical protein N032_08395 [Pseudomonas syringae pv. pisi str. PP1]|jgi:hypothetical protein|uniref:Uncharacterized protein n=2 Tax=Pseudomonas syringae group TaxID=136849 RepID=A0AB37ZUV0_PSESX|nr:MULTISPECIES: hypothetical protein [Pseudomonas]RMR79828.1 hypothetical protein ALP78_200056 [Pseudomonas coronafaciens pv. striafaciens]AZG85695.1 hypothetical protein N032_08395 [Pseudomonas syringae pv. pisi str. PP1]MBP1123271.1 hypothetical protein [Pseudomonas sp. PvP028]UZS64107.1 hypothetical protein OQB64_08040 [Pseudomonas syringae]SDO20175.1 hypothetical protein SAMN05444505_11744 [Pseudomonas syringae]
MLMYRKWTSLLGLVLAVIAGFAHADNRPEVAEKVLAYPGEGGLKVLTLRIGARSDNQALVQLGWCERTNTSLMKTFAFTGDHQRPASKPASPLRRAARHRQVLPAA